MEWSLLAPLTEADRAQVLRSATRRRFARAEVVVHEGDPANSMHLIASGRLAVRVTTRSGETATLNVLSPGDFFGELSLVRRDPDRRRSATVACLEPSETLSLTFDVFRSLCKQFPAVEQLLVVSLAARVEELSGRLLEAMYVGLDRRIYRCLVRMVELYDEGAAATTVPLTQDQLADLVGGTRPSVNQVLRRLAAQGVVELGRGQLTILDPEQLRGKARL